MTRLDLHLSEPLNPTLILQVQAGAENAETRSVQLPVLVDTGFDDFLTIPADLAQKLGLEVLGEVEVELANGQQDIVQVARGTINLPQLPDLNLDIDIMLGGDEEALLGTRLLFELCAKFSIDFENSILSLENLKIPLKAD